MRMKNISTLFFFFCLITTGFFLSAQNPFTFTNANSKFASATFHSGNAVSVVDMDGDGMDDIARLGEGTDAYYTIQRTGNTFNNISAGASGLGEAWAMVVGDVDNNGVKDIAIGSGSQVRVIKANASLSSFTLSGNLPKPTNFFPQNMNFADIDNNGTIDLFVCNDVETSVMYSNSGSGTFPAMTNFFNAGNPGTDGSGNYGSIWTDVNNDGNVDLYVAHCRQGTGATDGRRLDQLFMNDGNGNYVLDATLAPGGRGLRNYAMTWTASFDDIDNDGDFDCVLTETDVVSKLLLNDGNGYFTDITAGSGFVLDVTPYQSKMEDLDNDGYVDIIISGDDARIFHNNHNNTFTRIDNLFNTNDMLSFATGDLNHDGKIDLYTSYGGVYNNPSSSINDVLWMNSTNNGNHFITFDLQGTVSNRDALGAKVEVYGAWGKQVREVRAGESYGTTNTFMCHFGLGTATMVDSAIVRWPSGQVTRLYTRPADQFIKVIEGQCSSPDNIIAYNGPSALCTGQSVTLTATPGYTYLWSNGATTQAITTSVTGDFTVKVTDANSGCSSISRMATIVSQPDETPTITAAGSTTFCEGLSVTLNGTFAAGGYLWSNGATTQNITVTQPGNYSLTIQGSCAAFTSQTITVAPITSHVSNVVEASTCENNLTALTLQATGTGSTYWYDAVTGGNLVSTGTSYTTPVLDTTTTYYVESRDTVFGISGEVGLTSNVFTGSAGGYFNSGSYAQVFDVLRPLTLKTVTVYANSTKNRTIELRNSGGTLLQSVTLNIAQGQQTITLNFDISVGTGYRLGWAGSTADFYRNSAGASYPYSIANLITITGNTVPDPVRWYAYYNWQVEEQPKICASIRVPVTAAVNALPSAAITPSGATDFCDGGSVTLTADANTSYLWSDNSTSQSLIATQSGTYSVTVTGGAGNCANSASITVTEFAIPDATITTDKPTSICTGDNVTLTAPAGLNYAWSNNATTESITVSADGTFTVTVTDNNSCSAESTPITVTVSNNAVAGITPSAATTFCDGGSVDLTASAGTSYLWSNNATTANITVNASGTFTVTVTTGNCTAVSSPLSVVVNPNPVVSMSGLGTQYFTNDAPITLNGTPAGGTFTGTGVSGNTFDPSAAGVGGPYTVTYSYTDGNGCSASATANVTVELATASIQIEGISAVTIFPNPSQGEFQLSLKSNTVRKIDIEITNYVGQKIFEERGIVVNGSLTKPISLSNAAKGVYSLIITSGKNRNAYKVVVQ